MTELRTRRTLDAALDPVSESNPLPTTVENLVSVELAVAPQNRKVYTGSGAAAISTTTTLRTDLLGKDIRIKQLTVTFSTAPSTSQNLTVTRVVGGSHGQAPAAVLFSQDPSATSATSVVQIWEEGGYFLPVGDEVTVAFTNTDARTVKWDLLCEVA